MKERLNYRRRNRKKSVQIEALGNAQKIVFAPFVFQVIGTMKDLGLLEILDNRFLNVSQIIQECKISEYGANVLLQSAYYSGVILKTENDEYSLSDMGKCFLYDEMTIKNFNFIKDVCYLGASELTNSLKTSEPKGLQKFFVDDKTIYPHVPNLEENVKKSWYEFDHFYSDDCFDEILKIIFQNQTDTIFDIGGNTGKFEKACLNYNKSCRLNIVDLPVNKEIALKNINSPGVNFIALDVLSEEEFPKMYDTIFMSQFLDCFSKNQAISILKKIKNSSEKGTKIFILEPIIDNQIFEEESYSLAQISLYFTCMANGNSKMYTQKEILDIIESAELQLTNIYKNIGKHCYTMLECEVV